MNDSSEIFPAGNPGVPAPPPQSFDIPAWPERALRLRPVWVGFVLVVLGFAVLTVGIGMRSSLDLRSLYILCTAPTLVYYFMIIHRMIRVLETQPGWSVEYTPAGVVWKQFIPLYGIYFLYEWTGDVESYINWRLGRESHSGRWAFLGMLAGFALRFYDSFLGLTLVIASLYFLYMPLRQALGAVPPEDQPAPSYDGTLGLR